MADAAPREATYADLQAVHPHLVAEIIHGAQLTHLRPSPRHSTASSILGAELIVLHRRGRGDSGWFFLDEPELHLVQNVAVPDIAGWRRERLKSLPDKAYMETPPDRVCEVISPSTEFYDRGAELQIYAEAGVAYLWLVNPVEQYLEAFQFVAGQWFLQATLVGADEVKILPFDAAPFSLGMLWPFDEPIDPSKLPN